MASKDKPYRVYRGGRAKGPIRPESLKEDIKGRDGDASAYKGPKPPRKPRRWRRTILLVVLGGGFARAGDLLFEPARRVVAERALRPGRDLVRIVPALLGPEAGLIGAGLVGFEVLATAS